MIIRIRGRNIEQLAEDAERAEKAGWLVTQRLAETQTDLAQANADLVQARVEGRREMREEAARTADRFFCGACGMDGKSSAAIRALS